MMKTSILFLLALALAVETIQAQGGKSKSRAGGKKVMKKGPKHGPFVPCWRFKNLKSCTCKDNKEYKKGGGNIWKNCKKNEKNPIQFCTCSRGTKTWKWTPRRKLCGNRKNVKSCTCLRKDGTTGKTARRGVIWKKCGGYKRIQSCECKKGPKWINEEKYVPPKEEEKKDEKKMEKDEKSV